MLCYWRFSCAKYGDQYRIINQVRNHAYKIFIPAGCCRLIPRPCSRRLAADMDGTVTDAIGTPCYLSFNVHQVIEAVTMIRIFANGLNETPMWLQSFTVCDIYSRFHFLR